MDLHKHLGVLAIAVALAACSSEDSGKSGTIGGPGTNGWTPNSFLPSVSFKNQCAAPRTGTDANGRPFPDTQGTMLSENNWLRSWTNELYLWYREVEDHDPSAFTSAQYFRLLKTFQTTPAGTAKDRYHFTAPTAEWQSYSQTGAQIGYGATFLTVSGAPPREVVVLLVEPGSPAAAAGLTRGDRIVNVDNVDVANGGNVTVLQAGLFPSREDETHNFGIRDASGTVRTVSLRSQRVDTTPVHTVSVLPTDSGNVGYILFNSHIASAEDGLIDAFAALSTENIQDLVLDLRYNGGGYIAIASQAAYMIAGNARTVGQDFERTVWNDRHTATNPVTGRPLAPMPFFDTTVGLSRPLGTPLPTLNLNRVYVLTSEDTCSASEAIMNGLRGVDVEVIQVGTTTCGKPYGFYDFDNCGTTYFSVQFQGVNAKGFGDYTDGFTPENAPSSTPGVRIPGCTAADDYEHALGDPEEGMLGVALAHRASGTCPPAATATLASKTSRTTGSRGKTVRPPYTEIRKMRIEDLAR